MDAAMSSAVSALQAQSAALSTVSNNLANSETTGYKAVVTQFNSLLTQSAVGVAYPAGGVQAVARQNLEAQGLVNTTTNTTDMAINGNGMFPVTYGLNGGATYYTRDGAFDSDQAGDLVLSGTNYYLTGWATDTKGNILGANPDNIASLQPININKFNSSAVATTSYSLQANFPAEAQSQAFQATYTSVAPPAGGVATAGAAAEDITMAYATLSSAPLASPPTTTYQLTVNPSNPAATLTDSFGTVSTAGQPLVYDVTVDNTGAITQIVDAGTGVTLATAPIPAVAGTPFLSFTPSDSASGSTAGSPIVNGPTSWTGLGTPFSQNTSMAVYDSLGVQQTFPITWTAEGNNNWLMTVGTPTDPSGASKTGVLYDSAGNQVSNYSYNVTFNPDGSLNSVTGLPTGTAATASVAVPAAPMSAINQPALSATWLDGASPNTAATNTGIAVDLGTAGVVGVGQTNGLSQFDTGETTPLIEVKSTTQNGVQYGQLTGVSVNSAGELVAAYNNGQRVPIFKVPVVTFPNENGLTAQSDGVYQQSTLSGNYQLNQAGTNGAGTITGEALEASNVDTSIEFSNMITSQQAYSAASQVIGTDKQLFQSLLTAVGA